MNTYQLQALPVLAVVFLFWFIIMLSSPRGSLIEKKAAYVCIALIVLTIGVLTCT